MNAKITDPSSSKGINLLKNPVLRVISTWIWWLVGAALTLLIIAD